MTVSEYLSVIFCWAVGGICFLHKTESYICFEVTSEIGRKIRSVYNIELHIASERDKLAIHFKKWEKLVVAINNQ